MNPAAPQAASPVRKLLWDLLAILGWPAFFLLPDRLTSLWLPPLTLLLCLAALRGTLISGILRAPAIAITGGMCYTIYLWHAPVLTVVDRLLRAHVLSLTKLPYPELFLTEAAIKTLAVALVSLPLFVLVERPCMDPQWPVKLASRLRNAPIPAPPLGADRSS